MTIPLLCLLAAAVLPARAASAPAARPTVALVVDSKERLRTPVFEKLSAALAGRAGLTVYTLDGGEIADPIEKGRVLAALQSRTLIVSVGDGATGFVTGELEDVPVYFVGAGLVRGDALKSKWVSGVFSYSIDGLLDAAGRLKPGTIGVLYTPGYEPVVEWIRKGASARRMTVEERKVASLKELAPAARSLMKTTRALWVAGDPLLLRGVGFEFLRDRALSGEIPVIASGPRDLKEGAFLAFQADAAALAERAAAGLAPALARRAELQAAPPRGTVLFNAALAREWGLAPASEWKGVH